MKKSELDSLLDRALSVMDRLLSYKDMATSALDTCSLEEEDAELCSNIETFPELLQLRVIQLRRLCTTDPKTFAKPRSGISSEEQYRAFSQSIVRELRYNISAAEQVLNRAQACMPGILSKVHPVSIPAEAARIWKFCMTEQPEVCGEEPPKIAPKEKKERRAKCRYFLSHRGQTAKNPLFQVVFNNETINILLNRPYSGRDLCQAQDLLLERNEECGRCSWQECTVSNIEEYAIRIRDGTGRNTKKPDNAPGCTKFRFTATNKLTAQS